MADDEFTGATWDGGWPDRAPTTPREKSLQTWINSLTNISGENWSGAKCQTESPLYWDVDFYANATEANEAGQRLCSGCPLLVRCAKSGLEPLSASTRQSGVIRAGVALGSQASRSRLRKIIERGDIQRRPSGKPALSDDAIYRLAESGRSLDEVAAMSGRRLPEVEEVFFGVS